jgi:hypothetical protein
LKLTVKKNQCHGLVDIFFGSVKAGVEHPPEYPFKEFSALDAHPGWHPISSNANDGIHLGAIQKQKSKY